MKMIALQSFSVRGAEIISQGSTFTTNEADAEIYIRNGLASVLSETEAPQELTDEPITGETEEFKTSYTEVELQEKTITDLRKIAKHKGIGGYSRMSKSELIFAILASQENEQIQEMEE
jgi:hypothetical protein